MHTAQELQLLARIGLAHSTQALTAVRSSAAEQRVHSALQVAWPGLSLAAARQLQRRIQAELPAHAKSVRPEPVEGEQGFDNTTQFYTSGDVGEASSIMSILWAARVVAHQLPIEYL